MRNIKFRGKTNTGNWIFGNLVYSENIQPAIYFEVGNGKVKSFDWAYILPESLCEFTGLIDKNNKEIFEGDILGGINSGDFIKWCDKCKSFEVFSNNDYCYSCEHDFFWCEIVDGCESKEVEVIGNIYDNPDLLN